MSLTNGIHAGVPRDAYDRIQRTNFSLLKVIGRSPAHYRHRLMERPEPTDALMLGNAVHIAALEPERFASEVTVYDGRRAGKEWDKFEQAHLGLTILKPDQHDLVRAIATAVRTDVCARRYVEGGIAEATALWTDKSSGYDCKARLDFIADCGAVVDLKTTRDASPAGFGRECWRYNYHVQLAWYADGYEAATGRRLPAVIVAVEKDAPHVVQVYKVPDVVLELGRETYRAWLDLLRFCRSESRWPGYFDGEMELELPRWATGFSGDEDASGLDLELGA